MACLILKAKARVENGHKPYITSDFRENNIFK